MVITVMNVIVLIWGLRIIASKLIISHGLPHMQIFESINIQDLETKVNLFTKDKKVLHTSLPSSPFGEMLPTTKYQVLIRYEE
jgi:hypothetical protein